MRSHLKMTTGVFKKAQHTTEVGRDKSTNHDALMFASLPTGWSVKDTSVTSENKKGRLGTTGVCVTVVKGDKGGGTG